MTVPSQVFDWSQVERATEWERVDASQFHKEIAPLNQPAVIKGLARDWPAVRAARESSETFAEYLRTFDTNEQIEAFFGAPEISGRFFYSEDLGGFNFEKKKLPMGDLLDLLLRHIDADPAPSFYAGAIQVPVHIPGIADENKHTLLDDSVEQLVSLWLGNRMRTAAHYDLPQNIACVLCGRRRFVLLPIEQITNLYVGPLDFTLAGQAISLVDFNEPDFGKHPRYSEALKHAQVAELGPGDALYIPSLWWHHVETLDPLGAMMNFWWRDAPAYMFTPLITLMHSLLSIRELPARERAAWRTVFDHYIFQTGGDPMEHLPLKTRGIMGEMTPERVLRLRQHLVRSLVGK
jgi:hypothetical protein